MNKCFLELMLFAFIFTFSFSAYSYRGYGYYSHGSTHRVRPYTNKSGVYHSGHLSGNPRSGVHCHNNICY